MKSACRCAAFAAVAAVLFCAATVQAEDGRDIFTAARLGDVQRLSVLLKDDPQLANARTPAGEAPLHYAAMGRSLAAAELLLEHGADAASVDAAGRTALHIAATSSDLALIARLLDAGADANAPDGGGETPLHLAARRFQPGATAALLAAGANPNARNIDGQAPLHVLGSAARDADGVQQVIDDIAEVLIAAGANPALLDDAGAPAWPHPAEEPGVPRQPTGYPTYDEIAATLLAKETAYPSLCKRYDLGASSTTKRIYALKISDNVGVEEDEPEFKYVSTMHGDEVTGVVMCLNLIDHLLTDYGADPRVTNIVNNIDIWIVPCMNPWGYTNNARNNANNVDLNRNFPEGSGPSPQPNTTTGRQAETATIMNWSFGQSFTLAANLHGGALVVNYPYDDDEPPIPGGSYAPTPDDDLFIYISEQYSYYNGPMWNSATFYHGITNGSDWYLISGGMQDWSYRYMGCNEVTIEVSATKSPAYTQMPTFWSQNRESMLAYMETCLIGVRGIVTGVGGTPLAATVTVAGRNHPVYTDPNVGDYHRMLMPGTYSLTFTAAGYSPITVNSVVVNSGAATRLDVSFVFPPTAAGANVQTPANTPLTVTLQATDDGLPNPPAALTYIVTSLPTQGTLAEPGSGTITSVPYTVLNGSRQVVYTPVPGYQGQDSFQFKANDGGTPPQGGDSNVATISITVGGPAVIYSWNMDANPGWTTQALWVWGTPTGGGGGSGQGGPDPTSGRTGTKVYGYNLSGNYASGIPEYHLTTTAINCTNLTQVSLKFWRWLGVERSAWDNAYVRVSNNGTTWTTVWQNPTSNIADTAWSLQSFDISAIANNKATLYVRWTMGTTDATVIYCGWNIDDVEVWGLDSTPVQTGACCNPSNGTCTIQTQSACTGSGGNYQGNGTTCEPNPCPQPTGACCYAAAPCAVVTQAACTAGGGGVYKGNGTTCTPQLCCAVPGDMNGDTYVDGADIQGFVDAMLAGFAPCADLATPYDTLDTDDVSAFVDLLLGS